MSHQSTEAEISTILLAIQRIDPTLIHVIHHETSLLLDLEPIPKAKVEPEVWEFARDIPIGTHVTDRLGHHWWRVDKEQFQYDPETNGIKNAPWQMGHWVINHNNKIAADTNFGPWTEKTP